MQRFILVPSRLCALAAYLLACATAHAEGQSFYVQFTLDRATFAHCDASGCMQTAEDYALPVASFALDASDLANDGVVDLRGKFELSLQWADRPSPRFTVASSSNPGYIGHARATIESGAPTNLDTLLMLDEWLGSGSTNLWESAAGRWSYTGRSDVTNEGLDTWFRRSFDRQGSYTISAVPEPGTAALLGLGVGALVASRWRRRGRQA